MGVPDLSGMLGSLLSNPEALGSVLNMASSLKKSGLLDGLMGSINGEEQEKGSASQPKEQSYQAPNGAYNEQNNVQTAATPDSSGGARDAFETFGQQSHGVGSLPAVPLLSGGQAAHAKEPLKEGSFDKGKDQRSALLLALRPYLSKARQEKIDSMIKLLGLLDLAEQFGGLLRQDGEREEGRQ